MIRPGRAAITWPYFESLGLLSTGALMEVAVFGSYPYCAWLNTLNASARNWKAILSVNLKSLPMPMSQLLIPGPRRMLRPLLPNWPARG